MPLHYSLTAAGLAEQVAQRCNPIVEAMYASRFDDALGLLERLRAAADVAGRSSELGEATAYHLDYLHYHIYKAQAGGSFIAADFSFAEAGLRRPAAFPRAGEHRDRLLLQLYASAERSGGRQFPPQQFTAMFERVPDRERTDEFWHFVANWAFTHRDAQYLAKAYEEFLTSRDRFASEWSWQRVHLMYRLLTGDANPQDVAQTLSMCTLKPQLLEFERHLWPLVLEAGLADRQLTAQFTDKRQQLAEA